MANVGIALAEVERMRLKIAAEHPGFIRSEEADQVLAVVQLALTEAGDEITRLAIERNEITDAMRGLAATSRQAADAMAEATAQLAAYKGELAARDGRETILTFDRIGTEGVPTNHPDGTILACTDSDRRWRLIEGHWLELTS